ncbi:hypothetical protein, partial [Bacillus pumilus]|uniref:hypothetical protein n=1 Tax=Bacillus pumilus TaxID=1408 RepID=UPI001C92FCE3
MREKVREVMGGMREAGWFGFGGEMMGGNKSGRKEKMIMMDLKEGSCIVVKVRMSDRSKVV